MRRCACGGDDAGLAAMAAEKIDIPIIIGDREIRTGNVRQAVMPHDHQHVLADWHVAEAGHLREAMAAAAELPPQTDAPPAAAVTETPSAPGWTGARGTATRLLLLRHILLLSADETALALGFEPQSMAAR